jgi:hypothetical protein
MLRLNCQNLLLPVGAPVLHLNPECVCDASNAVKPACKLDDFKYLHIVKPGSSQLLDIGFGDAFGIDGHSGHEFKHYFFLFIQVGGVEIALDLFDEVRGFTVGVRRLTEKLSVRDRSIVALVEGRNVEGDKFLLPPSQA